MPDSLSVLLIVAILGLGAALLTGYILRLLRKSREIERQIDHSKLKRWEDDED